VSFIHPGAHTTFMSPTPVADVEAMGPRRVVAMLTLFARRLDNGYMVMTNDEARSLAAALLAAADASEEKP
jgi:hypothetical protein